MTKNYEFFLPFLTPYTSRKDAGCKGVKFSQKNSLFSLLKPSFELSITLLTSDFFSRASLQTLWLTNLTVVLDLPSWWQSSIFGLEILIFRCENISITFCSNYSSFTSTGQPCISSLFLKVCWSCLCETFSKHSFKVFTFFWSLIFSSLSALIIEFSPSAYFP